MSRRRDRPTKIYPFDEDLNVMEEHEFDAAEVYVIALNGGAPTTDWTERSEWAENVCRPKGDVLPKTKGGAR